MATDRFGQFVAGVPQATRRALEELRRRIALLDTLKVNRAGDDITGLVTIYGGTDVDASDGSGFVQVGPDGSANMGFDNNEIQARSGGSGASLFINGAGGEVRLNSGNLKVRDDKEVTDASGRQFIRADTGRTSSILIQAGSVQTATDASGDITVTFTEAYSSAPTVVATRTGSTTVNIIQVHTITTTTFKARIYTTAGAAVVSTTRAFEWMSYGPKTL